MDNFAVDLDKVLDDFEMNEDQSTRVVPGKERTASGLEEFLKASGETPYSLIPSMETPVSADLINNTSYLNRTDSTAQISYDAPFEPANIDLSEADFAPSPPKTNYFDQINKAQNQSPQTSPFVHISHSKGNGSGIGLPYFTDSQMNTHNTPYQNEFLLPKTLQSAPVLNNTSPIRDGLGDVMHTSNTTASNRFSTDLDSGYGSLKPGELQAELNAARTVQQAGEKLNNFTPVLTHVTTNNIPGTIKNDLKGENSVGQPNLKMENEDLNVTCDTRTGKNVYSNEILHERGSSDEVHLPSVRSSTEAMVANNATNEFLPGTKQGNIGMEQKLVSFPEINSGMQLQEEQTPTLVNSVVNITQVDMETSEIKEQKIEEVTDAASVADAHTSLKDMVMKSFDKMSAMGSINAIDVEPHSANTDGEAVNRNKQEKAVGFTDFETTELSDSEMDAYLSSLSTETDKSDMNSINPVPDSPEKVPAKKIKSLDLEASFTESKDSGYSEPVHQASHLESLEAILTGAYGMKPSGRAATPMDDPGFSKVPGFVQVETTIAEEEEKKELLTPEKVSGVSSTSPSASVQVSAQSSVKIPFNSPNVVDSTQQIGVKPTENIQSIPQIKDTQAEVCPVNTGATLNTNGVSHQPASLSSVETRGTNQATPTSLLDNDITKQQTALSNSLEGLLLPLETKQGVGQGARPKEISQMKRPNSLLGLSTVTLSPPSSLGSSPNPAVEMLTPQSPALNNGPVKDGIDQVNERSPRKLPMKLEISSQYSGPNVEGSSLGMPNSAQGQGQNRGQGQICDVPIKDVELAHPDVVQQPQVLATAVKATVDISSTEGKSQGVGNIPGGLPSHEQESGSDRELSPASDEGASASLAPKQKRPTSLNIPPRENVPKKVHAVEDSAYEHDTEVADNTQYNSRRPFPLPDGVEEMSEPTEVEITEPDVAFPNPNPVETQLGKVAPQWIPDNQAAACMHCGLKFTFTRRRHHCRACGKVFCAPCCNLKLKLQYQENKESRVCQECHQAITRAEAYERIYGRGPSPNPNNPSEYCSTIPPSQQANANAPPPTVMVPSGVLKREGSSRRGEPKQVMFSDGIRPGGDLTELDGSSEPKLPLRRSGRSHKKVERTDPGNPAESSVRTKRVNMSENESSQCLIPEGGLPPLVVTSDDKKAQVFEANPSSENLMSQIKDPDSEPVEFAVNKNLFVKVKILNLDCCVNRTCWCFSTHGMCTVGQEEMVIVLECLPDEQTIPRDIFCHFSTAYQEASKGNTVTDLGHSIFSQSFLDSRDHGGFLYIKPSFQCLQKLILPSPPYIFGILLQKWETPWAKVFPLRLMLRLGAEYRYYPCPLISVRFRKPAYGEIGHTIMNLLADFRNYQYMLPQIRGVVIHMEDKKTYINFPRNRYDEVLKVVNNSNEHVMALGANFSTEADSHLVCLQKEDGNYQTQAINIQNKPRKVTGASFVVFNGALKTSSGLTGKSSIVEDGLMVQINSDTMISVKAALRDMRDYTIGCGAIGTESPEEEVVVQWVDDDKNVNVGVKSPIDFHPMDGVASIHIHNATDFIGEHHMIRWTEVFFIRNEDSSDARCDPIDLSRLAETLAQACCVALTPHLGRLKEAGLTKIGLRATIDAENVCYEVGSNGEKLPSFYMNDLDNELIPVIHNAGSQSHEGPVVLELVFHILN